MVVVVTVSKEKAARNKNGSKRRSRSERLWLVVLLVLDCEARGEARGSLEKNIVLATVTVTLLWAVLIFKQ
jgi:hypothetical protein